MQSILVPIDFSEVTDQVIEQAQRFAQILGSRLRLVHVAAPDPDFAGYEAGPQVVRDVRARELHEEHRTLQQLGARLSEQGLAVETRLVQGRTVEAILDQAEQAGADLIVIGSHGHGALRRALLGSVSEGVIRAARRPVLIVPAS